MEPTAPDDVVEVYHTESEITARRVMDVLLKPEGIRAIMHDRLDQALHGLGQPGGMYIAVPRADQDRAIEVLDEARENGFLEAEEGEII